MTMDALELLRNHIFFAPHLTGPAPDGVPRRSQGPGLLWQTPGLVLCIEVKFLCQHPGNDWP